jgi:predicted nucleic acid-binding protein
MWRLPTRSASVAGRIDRLEAALADGELWTCPPSLLEMRYSARDGDGFALTAKRLDALRHAPLKTETAAAAVTAPRGSVG